MSDALDKLLMSELRLGVMSLLYYMETADFLYLQEHTEATSGNLSAQLEKLRQAGYIDIEKSFSGKRPRTTCTITDKGRAAFEAHFHALQSYFTPPTE